MALLGPCASHLRSLSTAALLQGTVVVLDGEHLTRKVAAVHLLHLEVVGGSVFQIFIFHVTVRGDRPKHLNKAKTLEQSQNT